MSKEVCLGSKTTATSGDLVAVAVVNHSKIESLFNETIAVENFWDFSSKFDGIDPSQSSV